MSLKDSVETWQMYLEDDDGLRLKDLILAEMAAELAGNTRPDGWHHAAGLKDGIWTCVWCSKPAADHIKIHPHLKEPFKDAAGAYHWRANDHIPCRMWYDFCHCLKGDGPEPA